ncbi:ATP-binding cassette domain-containing protein [Fulvimarina endophytica]|uniref:ATP-binding cassette domain-containing protein n=1 Tax=Fulvimarina endophytica TaxID=2293836 RepID=A0A371X2X2_9HYPH|nr:ATP-binding cassette domain-containing protein [Fulvimarina endophytica]RFC63578.1 ATP-binding cassette domain-containing protein [Fulvimarina endophytica]
MSDTPPALLLDGAGFARAGWSVSIDLSVAAGEWLALIGPSGAGKSTLLDMVAGFLPLDRGRILVSGEDVTRTLPAARPLSIVFQDNNLFPDLTAAQNVALGIAPNRRMTREERQAVTEGLEAVGLAGKGERRPHELSGGERQRVALARAFLRRRPLLCLDEPFASLGPALRLEMLETLDRLRRSFTQTPLTILMVTHHPEDARAFADRIAFLDEGRIGEIGPVERMLGADAPEEVARYLGAWRTGRNIG